MPEPEYNYGSVSYRGVEASVTIEDDPDIPDFVLIKLHVEPPLRGMAELCYAQSRKAEDAAA